MPLEILTVFVLCVGRDNFGQLGTLLCDGLNHLSLSTCDLLLSPFIGKIAQGTGISKLHPRLSHSLETAVENSPSACDGAGVA